MCTHVCVEARNCCKFSFPTFQLLLLIFSKLSQKLNFPPNLNFISQVSRVTEFCHQTWILHQFSIFSWSLQQQNVNIMCEKEKRNNNGTVPVKRWPPFTRWNFYQEAGPQYLGFLKRPNEIWQTLPQPSVIKNGVRKNDWTLRQYVNVM